MTTSHFTHGASRFLRLDAGAGDLTAFAANDNRVPRNAPLPFARGIVLAMDSDAAEEPSVSLHLLLPGGEVGVPFHSARHDVDLIALWRGLGRDFNLPLFLRSSEGVLSAVSSTVDNASPHPRRIGSPLAARRPRFLARRGMPLSPHELAIAARAV